MNRTRTCIGIAVVILFSVLGVIVISNFRPWDACGPRSGMNSEDEVIRRLRQVVETQNPSGLCPAVDPSVSKSEVDQYVNDVAQKINDHGGIDNVMYSFDGQLGRGYFYTIKDKQTGDIVYYISIASYHRGFIERISSIPFVSDEYFYIHTENK